MLGEGTAGTGGISRLPVPDPSCVHPLFGGGPRAVKPRPRPWWGCTCLKGSGIPKAPQLEDKSLGCPLLGDPGPHLLAAGVFPEIPLRQCKTASEPSSPCSSGSR